jgi:hypothetical protein
LNPEDLAKILDDLTARFGPAATKLWELAVRQSMVEGAASLVAGLLLVIVPTTVWLLGVRWYWVREWAKKRGYSGESEVDVFPIVVTAVIPLLPLLVGGAMAYSGLVWALNPEWQAIQVLSRLLPQ